MGLFFRRYSTRLNLGEKEIKRTLARRLGWIFGIVVAHSLAFFAFEPVSFSEALWVTVTTLTTVGYGDISATTGFGQISTTVLCFLVGIPILASVWDAYASWRDGVRHQKRAGLYNWDLKDHILIANFPDDYTVEQMVRLIRSIRSQKSLAKKPIQILTNRFGGDHLPQDLINLGNIAHVNGLASSKKALALATAEQASHVVILRERNDNDPEGHSFNVCARIRDVNKEANITVQVDDPHSRATLRLYRAGASNLLRPAKAYPEIIAMSMITAGVNDLFEDLLSIDGTEFRLIPYQGRVKWSDIQDLAESKDYGSPIGVQKAFTTPGGTRFYQPVLAPSPSFEGDIEGVYVISRKKNGESFSDSEWQSLLGKDSGVTEAPCSQLHILNLPVNQACPLAYLSSLLYQLRSTTKYADSVIRVISEDIPESIKAAVNQGEAEDQWIWKKVELIERVPSDAIFDSIEADTFQEQYDRDSVVAILNNDDDNDPDGYTYELIDLLRIEGGYTGMIVAEAESDNERERLYLTGANHCLRPVRGYPGMLARTLTNPGVEKAIEAFFRFNDLHIQRMTLNEAAIEPTITFGQLKHLHFVRSKGIIPLSIRGEGDVEDHICPSDETPINVRNCSILALSRD